MEEKEEKHLAHAREAIARPFVMHSLTDGQIKLVSELFARGYSDESALKIPGGSFRRVCEEVVG